MRVRTGSGAGDWGGLPGGRRRALASGGQARPRPLGPPSILPAHRAPGPRPGGCGFCSGGSGGGGRERSWKQAAGPAREQRAGAALAQVRAASPSAPYAPSPPPHPPTALLPSDPQVLLVLNRLPPPWPPPDTGYCSPSFRPGVSLPSGHSPSARHLVSPARQGFQLTRGAGRLSLEPAPF